MSCSTCGSNSITSCGCTDNCPNKTSDITLFDGNLSYVEVPAGSSLNEVLLLMESYIATSINDLNLNYVLAGGNCLGLAAGTYGYNQILTAIINELCSLADSAPTSITTDDVVLDHVAIPECFAPFEGVTSTDLFNAILEEICAQKTEFIPYAQSYSNVDIAKYTPLSILADIISGMVDNSIYVYNHTTVVTSPTLLNITVNPMKAVVNNTPVYRADSEVFSLTPSKDIYFALKEDGGINKITQTIGAPAPSMAGVAYLYKIVTDGSGVVSYSEEFEPSPFNAPSFSIPNDYIVTAMIADDQVTSPKLADVTTGATVGDSSILSVTYNDKGQMTSADSYMSLSGLSNGDILKYDSGSGGFVNSANLNTGTAGFIPISIGTDFSSSSIEENPVFVNVYKNVEINTTGTPEANSDAGLNVVSGTFVVPRYTAADASLLVTTDGTLIYVTTTNVNFPNIGFWGVEGGAFIKL